MIDFPKIINKHYQFYSEHTESISSISFNPISKDILASGCKIY